MKSFILLTNEFRIGFVYIGLENVTVAVTRVTDVPSRRCKKEFQKRRCPEYPCENMFCTNAEALVHNIRPPTL